MSALFGTRTQNAVPASSLNVQTSVQGIPIPIAYGKTRAPGNLINYTDFAASKANSGGKGGLAGAGGKGSGSSYSYTAAVQIGLCEGPIQSVPSVFNNQTQQSLPSLNLVALTGGYTQTAWGYEQSLHPAQALNYRGLARVVAGPLTLGSSPALPNFSFVVHAAIADAVAGLPDADPSAMITDILTNPNYGVGVPASRIGDLSVYTAYCRATGMLMSQMITDLTTAQELVGTWLEATNSAAVWSQGQLKIVPYGDQAITAGTVVQEVEAHVVPNPTTVSGDPYAPPTIILQYPGTFVADLGVTVASTGNAFTKVSGAPGTRQYQMATPGTYVFSAADENLAISIAYSYSEPASYSPPAAPLYAFGDDDFVVSGAAANDAPVQISRSAPQDQKNSIIVNFIDRSNAFALTPTPAAKDDAAIQMYGLRQDAVRDYHFFCYAEAATMSAHLLLGRQLVRNTYVWTADASFILLDPADLVSLTDTASGLNQQWVRITEIQENSDLTLTFTAEDYLAGSAHAPLYGSEPGAGFQPNYEQDPGFINAPVIFEPPSTLTGGTNELWVGISGASAVWGGCDVYVSYDDTTFTLVPDAHLVGPARTGVLTAALPAATSNPDANTLAVDVSASIGAQLTSTTQSDAAALATLCYVDGELLAYQTATLTSAGHYSLTGLVRGGYGSPAGTQASGAPFLRLDDQVIKIPYNKALVGQQIFLKFVSFNIWGRGAQSLSIVQAYEYVFGGGQPPGVLTGLTASLTQSGLTATLIAAWAPDALSATYQAQVSSDDGTTWTTVYDGAQPGFRQDGLKAQVIQIRARGVTSTGIDGVWSTLTVTPASTFSASASGYGSFIGFSDIAPTLVDPALLNGVDADLAEMSAVQALLTNNAAANAKTVANNSALQVKLGDPTTGLAATYSKAVMLSAVVNDPLIGNAAIAQTVSTLSAALTGTSGQSLSATYTLANNAYTATQSPTTGNNALASSIATLNSQIGNGTTGLSATYTLANNAYTATSNSTTGNNALASSIATLNSQIGNGTTGLSATYTLANNAYTATSNSTTGNAALATSIAGVSAVANGVSASGQIQFTAQSAPSGVTARFATTLSVTGQASATGGFYLDLVSGVVTATFDVASFKVQSGSTRSAPFAISGGAVYLTGVTYVSSTLLSQTLTSGGATPNVSILQQDFVNGAISVYDNT